MEKIFKADHYDQIDLEEWRAVSSNFSPKELSSKGNNAVFTREAALIALQAVRTAYGKPLFINSAYRDPVHNRRVGGSWRSQHVQGRAFDIHIEDVVMGRELEQLAVEAGFTAIGRYSTFIHVDIRPPKANGQIYQWGSWND